MKPSVADIHIVLVEPEIPQNTGNIARTCAATGASLHLVEPLGFSLEDKYVRRAGLDYWDMVSVRTYESLEAYTRSHPQRQRWYVSKKATCSHVAVRYAVPCSVIFGKETAGLPDELLCENQSSCVRIPMVAGARSLNLSNAVAVLVYEVERQYAFAGLV